MILDAVVGALLCAISGWAALCWRPRASEELPRPRAHSIPPPAQDDGYPTSGVMMVRDDPRVFDAARARMQLGSDASVLDLASRFHDAAPRLLAQMRRGDDVAATARVLHVIAFDLGASDVGEAAAEVMRDPACARKLQRLSARLTTLLRVLPKRIERVNAA